MTDLKKKLLDLAEDIQFYDMFDLTKTPKLLKEAVEKIGKLELEVIELQARLAESRLQKNQSEYSTFTTSSTVFSTPPQPVDRAQIKLQLQELGVPYSNKDNTQRLLRKLQRALRG